MKATHRRIIRWVLGVVAAVVLVAAFLIANVAAQLSGGWEEVFDWSHPQPGDPGVVAAREAGGRVVDAEIGRVVDGVVVPTLTAGRVAQPARTGPEAQTDRSVGIDSGCEVGSHNWKRDDPYDLLCVEIRRAVVAAEEAAFRADMTALHRALLADGWQPRDEFSGLPEALERVEEDSRLAGTGQPAITDFTGAGYRSADGRFSLELSFRSFDLYTGRPAPELAADEYGVMVSLDHESYLD